MGKFSDKLKNLFSHKSAISQEFFEDLADLLIEGDLGPKTAFELTDTLESICKKNGIKEESLVIQELKKLLLSFVKEQEIQIEPNKTNVFLVLGVNGVGKTTSVAKVAKYFVENEKIPVTMAAADTFRAAAIEQLQFHGEKLNIRVVAHQSGSDPSAVVFDAAETINSQGGGVVLADTAGRLHNKENLVRELQKIDRIARQKASEGCYKKILVLDATTGQNALRQAEVFNEAVGVDAIILTKYDSTAKGGVVVSIGKELGIPVCFVGTGETYGDIGLFNAEKYIDEFLGL